MANRKNYPGWYEETIMKVEMATGIKKHLADILADKREFGLKKYEEESYQISEGNSLNVNIKKHAKEEVVDLLNYLLHMAIMRKLNGTNILTSSLDDMIKTCQDLYEEIDRVKLKEFD